MSNRKVLLVTPFFAPQNHAAVFRVHKLAKYLPRFGWKPYVVTTDVNYLYNEDVGLLEDLPEEVEIHRVRYVEPTLRGLRMASGGRDRSFLAGKESRLDQGNQRFKHGDTSRRTGQRLYRSILDRWLQVPDPYWTWRRSAVRKALQIIEEKQVHCVYTTFLPYTSNLIGRDLQKAGCKWLADFRDPGTYSKRLRSRIPRIANRQRNIERQTLELAQHVTVLSSAYPLVFEDQFGPICRDRIHFIPTGADEDLFPRSEAEPPVRRSYLLFAGEFLRDYSAEFFEAYALARERIGSPETEHRLLFVGHLVQNQSCLLPILDKLGLSECAEFQDQVPQRKLYEYILHAKACLLLPGRVTHWWTHFAKMVDYVAMRKPTIAVVPDPSEARSVLSAAGLGIFLDGDVEESAAALVDFLTERKPTQEPNDLICRQYSARQQASSFVELLEDMQEGTARSTR